MSLVSISLQFIHLLPKRKLTWSNFRSLPNTLNCSLFYLKNRQILSHNLHDCSLDKASYWSMTWLSFYLIQQSNQGILILYIINNYKGIFNPITHFYATLYLSYLIRLACLFLFTSLHLCHNQTHLFSFLFRPNHFNSPIRS